MLSCIADRSSSCIKKCHWSWGLQDNPLSSASQQHYTKCREHQTSLEYCHCHLFGHSSNLRRFILVTDSEYSNQCHPSVLKIQHLRLFTDLDVDASDYLCMLWVELNQTVFNVHDVTQCGLGTLFYTIYTSNNTVMGEKQTCITQRRLLRSERKVLFSHHYLANFLLSPPRLESWQSQ